MTVDELRDAINGFSQADKLRLRAAARYFSGWSKDDWGDLLNEAVARALDGSRQCPRNTAPVTFLKNAMRSIVSAERETAMLRPKAVSLSSTGTDDEAIQVAAPARNAEQTLVARDEYAERLQLLEDLFRDDEEAQMILLGEMDELDADAIRELTGLDRTSYATARRRIRRRIETALQRERRT